MYLIKFIKYKNEAPTSVPVRKDFFSFFNHADYKKDYKSVCLCFPIFGPCKYCVRCSDGWFKPYQILRFVIGICKAYVRHIKRETQPISQIIPGQFCVLHARDNLDTPSLEQLLPPCWGGGLSHVRVLYCRPPPQVTLQAM